MRALRINKKQIILYLPLFIIELYLCTTLIFFAFGPIEWPVSNSMQFYSFILLYHLAFILGYIINNRNGLHSQKEKILNKLKGTNLLKKISEYFRKHNFIDKYVTIGLIILFFVNYFRLARVVNSINPLDMIKYVYYGIFNSYELYQLKFMLNQNQLIGGRIITVLTTFLSPIYWPVYPLMFMNFTKTKRWKKMLFIFAILFELGYGVAIGTNKIIFDLVIIYISIVTSKFLFRAYRDTINLKRIIIITFSIFIGLFFILVFFNFTMQSRLGGLDRFVNGYLPGININLEKNIMAFMSDGFKFLYILVCIYLTQGYFGMSLALKLPFKSSFGLGNNNFFLSNAEELFNVSLRENLYQTRITEYAWNPTVNWHSFYTWIANDVSFYGVILIMFILGYLVSAIWKDVILEENLFAICLIPLLVIMFIFLPCNNQIFSLPTTCMPFIFLFLLWIVSKGVKKYV